MRLITLKYLVQRRWDAISCSYRTKRIAAYDTMISLTANKQVEDKLQRHCNINRVRTPDNLDVQKYNVGTQIDDIPDVNLDDYLCNRWNYDRQVNN